MIHKPGGRSSVAVVPRKDASALVFMFAGACALTIAATRAYLVMTGYPQVGGKVYHLAHALWGGLLLTIACLLAIALHDRWVPSVVALAGGAGAGLFVDEVGKFITKKNDYFFPLAASIVYLFLVLLALMTVALSRYSRTSPQAHLHCALEIAAAAADGRLTETRREELREHLDAARRHNPTPDQIRLIDSLALLTTLSDATVTAAPSRWAGVVNAMGERGPRFVARSLMLVHALAGVLAIIVVPASLFAHAPLLPSAIAGVKIGSLAATMTLASMVVSIIAGALAFSAYRAMSPKRTDVEKAWRRGATAMILLLAVANSLGAYTSQFEVLAEAALQAIALGALMLWVRAVRTRRPSLTQDFPSMPSRAGASI